MKISDTKYISAILIFLLALIIFQNDTFSQSTTNRYSPQKKDTKTFIGEKGLFPLSNYSTKTYNALPQNRAIVQDKRGVMYFANNEGVLEYDGVFWRTIKVPNETNILSLAIDDNGKIYVGAS